MADEAMTNENKNRREDRQHGDIAVSYTLIGKV